MLRRREAGVVHEQQFMRHTCSRIASAICRGHVAIAEAGLDDRRGASRRPRSCLPTSVRMVPPLALIQAAPSRPSVSHAGHHDAQHAAAVHVGGRLKQRHRPRADGACRADGHRGASRPCPASFRRSDRWRPAGARRTHGPASQLHPSSASQTVSGDSSSSLRA